MDPVSQGALAAIAAQNSANRQRLIVATLLGTLAGMAPDLDVFIRSDTDPLLFLEYHRQFTHSLIFIPVGGLLCALCLHWLVKKWTSDFRRTLTYCTAGYATHGLLDACTSYGTQLFWPFSTMRVAWSNIAIVDPLFTVPIVVLIALAVYKKRIAFCRFAAIWAIGYLLLGAVQNERAERAGYELAHSRGHEVSRLEAKPAVGSLLLWKVIYESGDRLYVDGIRTGVRLRKYPGTSIAKLNTPRDFPWLSPTSRQYRDIQRFTWFSGDWVAISPGNPMRIIDARYSMVPNEIDGLWMIELDRNAPADQHVGYAHEHEGTEEALDRFVDMLLNR